MTEAGRHDRLAILARAAAGLRCSADPAVLADVAAQAASTLLGAAAVVQIRPGISREGAVRGAHVEDPGLLPEPDDVGDAWAAHLGRTVVTAPILLGDEPAGLIAAACEGVDEPEAQWLLDALAAHLGDVLAALEVDADARAAFVAAYEAGLGEEERRRKTLSIMSHDFRSPLASLQIGCDMVDRLVLQQKPYTEIQDILLAMRGAARQVTAMAENLVELTRLDKGVTRVQAAATDLEPILTRAMDSVADRAAEAEVVLERTGDVPARIVADADRLMRVLGNLLGNAIDFSAAGDAVSLSAERDGETVHLTVQDAGPGIPAELRGAIFEPFVEARSGHGLKPGLGLGLAVSRELVRRMGGDLVLHDAGPGRTAFRIALPTG